MRHVLGKTGRENQTTHFTFNNSFSKIAPCIRKCGKINVIFIAFPSQQLFRQCASTLRYTYIACLVVFLAIAPYKDVWNMKLRHWEPRPDVSTKYNAHLYKSLDVYNIPNFIINLIYICYFCFNVVKCSFIYYSYIMNLLEILISCLVHIFNFISAVFPSRPLLLAAM
jgi:hypothetical protein